MSFISHFHIIVHGVVFWLSFFVSFKVWFKWIIELWNDLFAHERQSCDHKFFFSFKCVNIGNIERAQHTSTYINRMGNQFLWIEMVGPCTHTQFSLLNYLQSLNQWFDTIFHNIDLFLCIPFSSSFRIWFIPYIERNTNSLHRNFDVVFWSFVRIQCTIIVKFE